jgi:hypothetical protein
MLRYGGSTPWQRQVCLSICGAISCTGSRRCHTTPAIAHYLMIRCPESGQHARPSRHSTHTHGGHASRKMPQAQADCGSLSRFWWSGGVRWLRITHGSFHPEAGMPRLMRREGKLPAVRGMVASARPEPSTCLLRQKVRWSSQSGCCSPLPFQSGCAAPASATLCKGRQTADLVAPLSPSREDLQGE